MLSIFSLFIVYLRSRLYFFWQERRVSQIFYNQSLFQKCDLAIKKAYRVHSPFAISKDFLKKRGEIETDVYGEIPLTSLEKIAKECALEACDHVFELGCGRGRAAFFLRTIIGCRITAIDWIPFFITNAQKIAEMFCVERITFMCTTIQSVELHEATCIYLYRTCLSDKMITQLCVRFISLSSQVKIITLSYPLKDYHPGFKTLKQFFVSVPWGRIEVFLNQKTCLCTLHS